MDGWEDLLGPFRQRLQTSDDEKQALKDALEKSKRDSATLSEQLRAQEGELKEKDAAYATLQEQLALKDVAINELEEETAGLKDELAARDRRRADKQPQQAVTDEIRSLSTRIKQHVDALQSVLDSASDAEKLGRQERNYNAVAGSLAKAIEEAEKPKKMAPAPAPAPAFAPRRRRTASEVCEMPDNSLDAEHAERAIEELDTLSGQGAIAREWPVSHQSERAHDSSSEQGVPPAAHMLPEQAHEEEAEYQLRPRIQWPAFTLNPDSDLPQEGPNGEMDMGESCRNWLLDSPQQGRIMQGEVVEGREWRQLSLVADLPRRLGIPDEWETDGEGEEEPNKTPAEGSLLETVDGHANEQALESSGNGSAAVIDERPANFDWRAFHGTATHPEDDQQAAGEKAASSERHDSHAAIPTNAEPAKPPMPSPAPRRTLSSTERLPPRRSNFRDRPSDSRDPRRRNNLGSTRGDDFYRPPGSSRKRYRSPP